jgi:diguanylate cyclase
LKIDRDLVSRVGGPRDIVPAVLRLGRDLALSVVAEGIETVEQLALLQDAGCPLGQGYLFAKPLDPSAATRVIAERALLGPADSISRSRMYVSDDEIGHVTA